MKKTALLPFRLNLPSIGEVGHTLIYGPTTAGKTLALSEYILASLSEGDQSKDKPADAPKE